jgi:hypothetical protein
VSLPVAIASDTSPDARLDSIRVYHSMWPLVGFHLVRAPVLPSLAALALPDVVGRYHDCLARGDLSGILEQFGPGGELREAGGSLQVHRGAPCASAPTPGSWPGCGCTTTSSTRCI